MDMTHASERVGFVPQVTLKEGLQQVWSWYSANIDEHLSKQNYFR